MALDAMKSLGFSKKEATPVLRSLLKLFANNWEPIEDECYRALADAILDSRDRKVRSPSFHCIFFFFFMPIDYAMLLLY